MSKFIRFAWFPVAGGIYGFLSALIGNDYATPAFWLGMAFATVAYFGVWLIEDRL